MLSFLSVVAALFLGVQSTSNSAEVYLHCDNTLTAKQRQVGGSWRTIGTESNWQTAFHYMVIPVSQLTELRFECVDAGGIGGFIATIHYGGQTYSTEQPMSGSRFRIVEGDTENLVYHAKTSSPWNRHTEGIDADAKWVWNGKTFNTLVFEFSFNGLEAPEQCYFLEGNPAIVWGDPHTTTFAGVKHDYQGLPQDGLDQFYYMHPCAGYDRSDLPYTMIGRHFPYRGSVKVSGFDYMVLSLFEDDGTQYNVFFSSAIHEYGQLTNTDYDSVSGSLSPFSSGVITTIGTRFSVHYVQKDSKEIHVTLTVDNHCKLSFVMIGQYDYSSTLGRYTMHYVRVNPPECYKCAVCGLLGDFQGYDMQTCDGTGTVTYGSYTNAWDPRGWTWERTYTDNHCSPDSTPSPVAEPYVPEPDPTFPYDPCTDTESHLRKSAEETCQNEMERTDVSECCTKIGQRFCDDLMTNCAFDSCFTSDENISQIPNQVAEVFTNPILAECDQLVIEEDDYEEFATRKPTPLPTRAPVVMVTTTESPFTCCKDQMTEQDCLNNYLSGKPCTWLHPEDPLAVKFNTQCLGESLVANGPAKNLPGFTFDNPIIDYCHPEEFWNNAIDNNNEEKMAVKVDGLRMHRQTTATNQLIKFMTVAAVVLVLVGLTILYRRGRADKYEFVADPQPVPTFV